MSVQLMKGMERKGILCEGIALNDQEYKVLVESLHTHYKGTTGLKFPRGWDNLIADCHEHLTTLIPDYGILAIRENVGKMSYSTGHLPLGIDHTVRAQFHGVVRHYEDKSTFICQLCGHPGSCGNIWGRVFCAACKDRHEYMIAWRSDLREARQDQRDWPEEVIDHFVRVEGR